MRARARRGLGFPCMGRPMDATYANPHARAAQYAFPVWEAYWKCAYPNARRCVGVGLYSWDTRGGGLVRLVFAPCVYAARCEYVFPYGPAHAAFAYPNAAAGSTSGPQSRGSRPAPRWRRRRMAVCIPVWRAARSTSSRLSPSPARPSCAASCSPQRLRASRTRARCAYAFPVWAAHLTYAYPGGHQSARGCRDAWRGREFVGLGTGGALH